MTLLQVDYIFSLSVYKVSKFDANFRMVIDCESKLDGLLWRGDFQQKYIEEITNKAGNYKKFQIFTKMLMTAMKREQPDEVYLDLLTAQDLAQLKARKQGASAQSDHTQVDPKQKRYLILTLSGEYEKVHYPMPLVFLEEPDIGALRRTYVRL